MHRFYMAIFIAFFAMPALAQSGDGVFRNYEDLKQTMDQHIQAREIKAVMLKFGGADEMTVQQLDNLEARVRQIYPTNLENSATILIKTLDNGFRQELHAYWTGLDYMYTYLLIHDRDNAVVSINFQFNSDFHKMIANF